MKILLLNTIINMEELKMLKENNIITYNPNDKNIDLVIDNKSFYFYRFRDYSINYTHWLENTDLAFIVSCLEETLSELSSMNF